MIVRRPTRLQMLWAKVSARFSAKASAVGPAIARFVKGQAVWSGRNYEQLATEGYQQNPVVARAVQLIAESVAQIPWCLYQGKGKSKKEIEKHPFLDLMMSPNPTQDWQSLIAALVSNYKISGNLYCERTDEKDLGHMELYAHRPDRITVVAGDDGLPKAYRYNYGGEPRDFEVDFDKGVRPLLHLKTFNPTNDWYGLSPLDPCSWAIDISNASAQWNMSILNNAGAPSGALVYEVGKDGANERMAPDHYQQTLDMMRDDIQGSRNAGRVLLLEGLFKWLQFGFSPDQMRNVDTANTANRQIAFALGVPPQLLGIPGDNTFSNYQEARQAFYQETVIPMVHLLVRAFNHWFARALDKGLYLEANLDNLDALADARAKQWDRVERSTVLTLNEKRDALGYEPIGAAGDQHFIPAGLIPVDEIGTIMGGAADQTDPQGKPNGSAKHMPGHAVHYPQR